jgi:hypothetical protein
MGAQILVVGIFGRILGRANEQHVFTKVSNTRQGITELTDINVHGGRGLVCFGVRNQQYVHGQVWLLLFGRIAIVVLASNDNVLVLAFIN